MKLVVAAAVVILACQAAALAQDVVAEEDAQTLPASVQPLLDTAPLLPSEAETRELLRQILAQDEYQVDATPPQGESPLARLLGWLGGLLQRLGLGPGSWYGTVIIIVLALLLLFAVVRMLWQLASRGRAHLAEQAAGGAEQLPVEALLAAAEQAAQAGDHRTAIRLRFLALLRILAEPDAVLTTNRQLMRRVARRFPSLSQPFRELVLCYEDAWYGSMPCGSADYSRAGELAARLEARVAEEAGSERPGE